MNSTPKDSPDSLPDLADSLVITYNCPPFLDASSITVAKRIIGWGKPVDIIQQDMTGHRSTDPTLDSLIAGYRRNTFLAPIESVGFSWLSMQNFIDFGMAHLPVSQYKSMYSRALWPQSHFLAAAIKAANPEIFWSAEFSDPIRHGVDGALRKSAVVPADAEFAAMVEGAGAWKGHLLADTSIMGWAEMLPFALADEIVFTNETQRHVMLPEIPDLREAVLSKSRVSPHPTLPRRYYEADAVPNVGAKHFNIGYFGSFYPNRGLETIMEALSLLESTSIRLHVFSSTRNSFRYIVENAGLSDRVFAHEETSYLDALRLMDRFDALVVNDVVTRGYGGLNPYLPSKLSDYLGSNAEIIGLVQPGSTLDRHESVKHRAIAGDIDGVLEILRNLESSLGRTES